MCLAGKKVQQKEESQVVVELFLCNFLTKFAVGGEKTLVFFLSFNENLNHRNDNNSFLLSIARGSMLIESSDYDGG